MGAHILSDLYTHLPKFGKLWACEYCWFWHGFWHGYTVYVQKLKKKKNHKIILVCGLKERKICKRGKGWNPRFCFCQLLSEERKNLYFIKKYLTMLIPNLYPFFITQNLWNKWKNSLITKSLPFFMKRTKEMKKIRIR